MLSQHYQELMGKVEDNEGKYLIVNDYVLDKILDQVNEIIGIEIFDDTQTLIDTDDKLPDNISSQKFVILKMMMNFIYSYQKKHHFVKKHGNNT